MQDVRLYVALCLSEVLRIFAPEEPYDNEETLKSIYSSFLGAMRHLADPGKEAFQPAHALLHIVAAIGLLVPILDLPTPARTDCCPSSSSAFSRASTRRTARWWRKT